MKIEKVYFKTIDNLNLIGLLHIPDKKKITDTVIVSVHGITSNCLKYREDVEANKITEMGFSYFTFNNRGHDLITNYDKVMDDEMHLYGSCAENIYESYYDIKSAMLEMKNRGYKKIILEGHSMGCTKVVYTYNEFIINSEIDMLDMVTGVILLSMVDIPTTIEEFLGKDYKKAITYLQMQRKRGKGDNLVILDNSFPPVRPNTILAYIDDNKKIDFAKFGDKRSAFRELNNIKVPLFMRWGNIHELITQEAGELVNLMNNKIKKEDKDIGYIDGADHNYIGKEEELSEQICKFIKK